MCARARKNFCAYRVRRCRNAGAHDVAAKCAGHSESNLCASCSQARSTDDVERERICYTYRHVYVNIYIHMDIEIVIASPSCVARHVSPTGVSFFPPSALTLSLLSSGMAQNSLRDFSVCFASAGRDGQGATTNTPRVQTQTPTGEFESSENPRARAPGRVT